MSKKETDKICRISGKQLFEQKRDIIPCTLSADLGLGGGVPRGSTVLIGGKPKLGKALYNESLILYEDGWRTIGQAKAGDKVCGSDGKFYNITGVFPQGNKTLYKVIFNDGSNVLTCKDHLWKINYRISKKESSRFVSNIRTTEHIKNDLEFRSRIKTYKNRVHYVDPVQFPEKDLSIDPYILGKYLSRLSYNDNVEFYSTHTISLLDETWKESWKSEWEDRFISDKYLFNSVQNRARLLSGLLNENQIIVTNSSKLNDNIRFLVESLGGYVNISYDKDIRFYKINVNILDNNIRWYLGLKENNRKFLRTIVDVIESGEGECTCIQIDSPDHLFVTNNFILTHNTTISLQYGANAQRLYGSKIFYFNIEGRLSKLVLSQIQGLSLEEDKFEVISSAPMMKGDKIVGTTKLYSEQWWDEIGKCILDNPGSVIIVDSIANMSSEKEYSEGMGHQDRGVKNKLESQFVRKYGDLVAPLEVTLFLLTHIMANTSGYGSPFQAKVGNDIRHQADIILFGQTAKKWDEVDGKVLGHDMIYMVEASALGAPNVKLEIPLRYGIGCDVNKDIINYCINFEIIKKSGAWFTLPFIEKDGKFEFVENPNFEDKTLVKIQGQENIWNWLLVKPQEAKVLDSELRKRLML
jgi:hypothetical protein